MVARMAGVVLLLIGVVIILFIVRGRDWRD